MLYRISRKSKQLIRQELIKTFHTYIKLEVGQLCTFEKDTMGHDFTGEGVNTPVLKCNLYCSAENKIYATNCFYSYYSFDCNELNSLTTYVINEKDIENLCTL